LFWVFISLFLLILCFCLRVYLFVFRFLGPSVVVILNNLCFLKSSFFEFLDLFIFKVVFGQEMLGIMFMLLASFLSFF